MISQIYANKTVQESESTRILKKKKPWNLTALSAKTVEMRFKKSRFRTMAAPHKSSNSLDNINLLMTNRDSYL